MNISKQAQKRLAVKRHLESKRRRIEAVRRFEALAERDGPDSVWPELLAAARKRL